MSAALSSPLSARREFAFSEADFRMIARMVYQRSGIHLGAQKHDMVYSRLVRRLRVLGLESFQAYCALLESPDGQDEIGDFINAVTTNTTSFFRESHHFTHLETEVLRPLLRTPPPGRRLRIWSAGCSAGMEPYSIAMVLEHVLGGAAGWDARILATDIDTNMLATARAGSYPRIQADKIPPALRRYVTVDAAADTLQVAEALQRRITFNRLTFLEAWPIKGPFDVLFSRNVVIYFDKETQRRLFARLADLLKPGGWLYIGHSENLFQVSDRFRSCGKTIYQRED